MSPWVTARMAWLILPRGKASSIWQKREGPSRVALEIPPLKPASSVSFIVSFDCEFIRDQQCKLHQSDENSHSDLGISKLRRNVILPASYTVSMIAGFS